MQKSFTAGCVCVSCPGGCVCGRACMCVLRYQIQSRSTLHTLCFRIRLRGSARLRADIKICVEARARESDATSLPPVRAEREVFPQSGATHTHTFIHIYQVGSVCLFGSPAGIRVHQGTFRGVGFDATHQRQQRNSVTWYMQAVCERSSDALGIRNHRHRACFCDGARHSV